MIPYKTMKDVHKIVSELWKDMIVFKLKKKFQLHAVQSKILTLLLFLVICKSLKMKLKLLAIKPIK